jgi:hypothetical protein
MGEHLSDLVLDELSLNPEASGAAHAQECPSCRDRLQELSRQRARIAQLPGFEHTFTRVAAGRRERARRPRRWAWIAALAGAAALVAALPLLPGRTQVRLKGAPAQGALLRLEAVGARAEGPLLPGDRVKLVIGPARQRWAVVVSVDEKGQVSQLWPAGGGSSGAVEPGKGVETFFEVTPGSATVWAFFSDEPLSGAAAAAALDRAVARAREAGSAVLASEPEPVPGERERARLPLVVASAPEARP